jgi:GNAT superfamily N-acetyltransferase
MCDPAQAKWVIVPLSARHDRDFFDCGVPELNEFLKRYALQNQEKNISRTFVALRPLQAGRIDGYFTLSCGSVEAAKLAPEDKKRLPRYPLPVVHLGRLAVDRQAQGKGLGETLLMRALQQAAQAAPSIGIHSVEVCAFNEDAKRFYKKYGFKEFQDEPLHLYLPLAVVAGLTQPSAR